MRKFKRLLIVVVALCAVLSSFGQKGKVATSPMPAWVAQVAIEYNREKLVHDAEDGYLDLAFIKQVNLPAQTTYFRKSNKIINEQGIENISEVSVTYDPTYQQLTFHDIHILREGKIIDKLNKAKFQLLQQEQDAYMHLYDGSLTALLVLDDVRTGDIIEYAYSIKGFNPVYKGRYADFYSTAFSVPVGQLYYRLISGKAQPVYVENMNHESTPEITQTADTKTYVWSFTDVPAIRADDNLPSWYDAYPMIMISQDNDWLNIRNWAAALYPNNVVVQGELKKKIDAIKASNNTDDLRAAAALRFVQDDVRYLGIEMGTGSHTPTNPNKVFAQRYGDCKDKAYLLVTMLHAMGIPATPVLVNSSAKQTISRYLPSPNAFNHVTVRLGIYGKDYYVDPTLTNQRGSLDFITYPAYQIGLALADSNAGLTTINASVTGMVKVKETFSLPDAQGRATLIVVTESSGSFADDARYDFNNNSTFELQKKYKQFYSTFFEKIKADSLAYREDEKTGVFTAYEYYTIDNLWSSEGGDLKCAFSAFVINSYLRRPKDKMRTMPMAFYYPARYHEEIVVELPHDWSIRNFDKKIVSSVFKYKGKSELNGRTLTMMFDFESYKDHVNPEEIDELFANYKQIDDNMGWELSYTVNGSGGKTSSSAKETLSTETQKNIYVRLTVFFGILALITVFGVLRQRRRTQRDI